MAFNEKLLVEKLKPHLLMFGFHYTNIFKSKSINTLTFAPHFENIFYETYQRI